MSDLALFKNNKTALALLGDVQDNLTDTLAGSSGLINRRISTEGGVFREIINGKEVRVNEDRAMNVVIVNAAPISRMYYAGAYVKGQASKPTCWSSDTQTPDPKVPEDQRQAARCMDCKQNVRGSAAQGEGRACRFQQRIAVLLDGQVENKQIYQVQLPATSVFGDAENGKMPLQAYGRYLKAHNTHAISIVTEMRFDTSASAQKLVFKAVRPLEEAELRAAIEMRDHPDTIRAITLTVAQMDGVIPSEEPKQLFSEPKQTTAKEAKSQKVEVPAEEPVEEPKKVTKKSTTTVEEKADLSDIVGDWDD